MSNSDTVIGLDIGSCTIKMVVWDGDQVVSAAKTPTTFDPLAAIGRLRKRTAARKIVTTGYGKDLLAGQSVKEPIQTISTVQAFVAGARHLFPDVRTVLDIGGLNTMVISLTPSGAMHNYEISSHCAAGTGKYLEFMARSMQLPLEDFGAFALQADTTSSIEHSCTIFAETEAMFRVAAGEDPAAIARGLHMSHVQKTLEALQRVHFASPLLFTGGVAHNPCIRNLLDKALRDGILVPENPDIVGAVGAALQA